MFYFKRTGPNDDRADIFGQSKRCFRFKRPFRTSNPQANAIPTSIRAASSEVKRLSSHLVVDYFLLKL